MAIQIRCDLCNAVIEDMPTIGISEPTDFVVNTEKHCVDCSLQSRLDTWAAKLVQIRQRYRNIRIPQLLVYAETNIRDKFVKYAQAEAKAHFGDYYDAAEPTIRADVIALRDVPMEITITFNPTT